MNQNRRLRDQRELYQSLTFGWPESWGLDRGTPWTRPGGAFSGAAMLRSSPGIWKLDDYLSAEQARAATLPPARG